MALALSVVTVHFNMSSENGEVDNISTERKCKVIYFLCPKIIVVLGLRVASLTRFIEKYV